MSDLVFDRRSELHRPLLIAAWSAWSDAGESATGAVRFIRRRWRETPFAHIDADPYYDFTRARPRVRLDAVMRRSIRAAFEAAAAMAARSASGKAAG